MNQSHLSIARERKRGIAQTGNNPSGYATPGYKEDQAGPRQKKQPLPF